MQSLPYLHIGLLLPACFLLFSRLSLTADELLFVTSLTGSFFDDEVEDDEEE